MGGGKVGSAEMRVGILARGALWAPIAARRSGDPAPLLQKNLARYTIYCRRRDLAAMLAAGQPISVGTCSLARHLTPGHLSYGPGGAGLKNPAIQPRGHIQAEFFRIINKTLLPFAAQHQRVAGPGPA